MKNKIGNSKATISAQNQSPPPVQPEHAKTGESQRKQQKFLPLTINAALVLQATLIGIRGNFDILSGKPVLDVLPGMITQGIELIIKAQGVQKRLQKRDRNFRSEQ